MENKKQSMCTGNKHGSQTYSSWDPCEILGVQEHSLQQPPHTPWEKPEAEDSIVKKENSVNLQAWDAEDCIKKTELLNILYFFWLSENKT